jgi:hypothetical protein
MIPMVATVAMDSPNLTHTRIKAQALTGPKTSRKITVLSKTWPCLQTLLMVMLMDFWKSILISSLALQLIPPMMPISMVISLMEPLVMPISMVISLMEPLVMPSSMVLVWISLMVPLELIIALLASIMLHLWITSREPVPVLQLVVLKSELPKPNWMSLPSWEPLATPNLKA